MQVRMMKLITRKNFSMTARPCVAIMAVAGEETCDTVIEKIFEELPMP